MNSSKREDAEQKLIEARSTIKAEQEKLGELGGAHAKVVEELKQNKYFEAQLADSIPTQSKSTAATQGGVTNNSKITFSDQDELINSKSSTVRDVSQSRSVSPRNAALSATLTTAPTVRRSTRNLRDATQ